MFGCHILPVVWHPGVTKFQYKVAKNIEFNEINYFIMYIIMYKILSSVVSSKRMNVENIDQNISYAIILD